MNEYEWGAWTVEYNPQSDMFDVFSRRKDGGETRVHSSWNKKCFAEEIAKKLNAGEQI